MVKHSALFLCFCLTFITVSNTQSIDDEVSGDGGESSGQTEDTSMMITTLLTTTRPPSTTTPDSNNAMTTVLPTTQTPSTIMQDSHVATVRLLTTQPASNTPENVETTVHLSTTQPASNTTPENAETTVQLLTTQPASNTTPENMETTVQLLTTQPESSTAPENLETTVDLPTTQPASNTTPTDDGLPISTEDTTDDTVCVVPPYLTDVGFTRDHTSPEEFDEQVSEWECFLECARKHQKVTVDHTYEAWPFLALDRINCRLSTVIRECTRGCLTSRNDQCSSICGSHCVAECSCTGSRTSQCECVNPDANDPWFSTVGCTSRDSQIFMCSTSKCDNGCSITLNSILEGSAPSQPIAPPTLVPYSESSGTQFEAGLYTIDLTSAIPVNTTTNDTVSFVLRIVDLQLGNVQYRWQHSPREVKSLADFVCRNVSLSFAVVNVYGHSEFSPAISLQVYGDSRHVPNGVVNIVVNEDIDTRVGYFGHARLTVTWDKHENGIHLQHFQVFVTAPSKDVCGNDTFMQQINATENVTTYSIDVEAESPSGIPFMGCTNHIIIFAVGSEGSTSELDSIPLRKIHPPGVEFLCSRIWDSATYFAFNLTWILPPYLMYGHIIEKLQMHSYIVDETNTQVNVGFSLPGVEEIVIPDTNETVFELLLDETGEFYKPQMEPNRFYRFAMYINWNEDNLQYEPDSKWYECLISARSPPPSTVRNLVVVSHSLVGNQQVSLKMNWLPPAQPNGVLDYYDVCIGPYVLNYDLQELPKTPHSCRTLESTASTTNGLVLHYFKNDSSSCLYVQIRASNQFVSGNWSEPSVFSIDGSDTCEIQPTVARSSSVKVVVPAVACGIIAVIVVFACIVCAAAYARMLRRRKRFWRISHEPCNDPMFTTGPRNPFLTSPTETGPLLPTTDEWEISPSEVLMEDLLGEGAFGEVYKGVLKGPITSSTVRPWMRNAIGTPVAIKLLKLSARGSERQDFLSEIEMMKRVAEGQNANVVCLLACVTIQEPLCLITEFVKFGDLLSYLRNNRKFYTNQLEDDEDVDNTYIELGNIYPTDLISFAYQIASGMEYLSSLGIVHRDLASRNVLVDEGKVLKITDFGMSRTTETNEIYVQKSKGRVPLKWMAIESIIAREFTTFSDVWSYGVTLWEITTLGGFPYPTVHNEDMLSLLKQGYRMEKPDNCSPEIYDIMFGCWHADPKKRPTFTELRARFDNMLRAEGRDAYIDLQIDAEKPYYQMDFKMELSEQQQQSANHLHVTPTTRRHSLLSGTGNHTPRLATSTDISPAHLSLSANSPHGSHPSMGHGASPSKEPLQTTELHPNGSAEVDDIRRPVSLLLPGRERQATTDEESRYVAEPSRLAACLNDHLLASTESPRRRSDSGLIVNLNGVVSNHHGNGDISLHPDITVTAEDTV